MEIISDIWDPLPRGHLHIFVGLPCGVSNPSILSECFFPPSNWPVQPQLVPRPCDPQFKCTTMYPNACNVCNVGEVFKHREVQVFKLQGLQPTVKWNSV